MSTQTLTSAHPATKDLLSNTHAIPPKDLASMEKRLSELLNSSTEGITA